MQSVCLYVLNCAVWWGCTIMGNSLNLYESGNNGWSLSLPPGCWVGIPASFIHTWSPVATLRGMWSTTAHSCISENREWELTEVYFNELCVCLTSSYSLQIQPRLHMKASGWENPTSSTGTVEDCCVVVITCNNLSYENNKRRSKLKWGGLHPREGLDVFKGR